VPAGVSARFVARRFGIVTLWVGGGLLTASGLQALEADRSVITALMPVAFVTGFVLLGWTLHGIHVSEAGRTEGSDAEQRRDG
jgi:predicted exporter